ncbi:TldD/PmbA family protein [Rhodococcus triatomae]|uniref:Predicted Zn-dependent protease or its inactivated homolog n=1 Tax=Rhodococcus triatomae TaxID=300028 RepID=A0A1G8NZ27_9NOCA|nr:metallopeptidase TldD-related protein [Rhodococcus triatomae]QNG18794.1 TldD/PmbA family protein [Rhodococcus triatomae]QNG25295.1 TldD/PmbA family protein [Rhodococcus triatomae]SDI85477.1 Predicted Zn-dependent protease or its inactivated homolog [Rhodococcus triatomae]
MIPAQQLVEQVLTLASVDDTIVLVTDTSDASLRWARSSMTTNGISTSRRWSVISVVRDGDRARVGVVTTGTVDAADVSAVVRASEEAARGAEPAPDARELVHAGVIDEHWGERAEGTEIGVFEQLAQDLARGFDSGADLYGFAEHSVQTVWLGTSAGVRRRFVQPTGSVEINGKRGDDSAWVGVSTRDFTDVASTKMLEDLHTRLDWAARRIDLPAGRYETLLPPSAVADLMIYLMWSMDGRAAQEGRSALSAPGGGTRVGEQLSTLPLTLYSDPHALGMQYAPFVATSASSDSVSVFDNGMDAGRVDWVHEGAAAALAYPRAAAAEFGTTAAVPGDNLILEGGGPVGLDEMVAATERGLLLSTLWYIREVDPATLLLTGLTRDGVYLVEDGQVTGSVNNFRFNESPLDLLRRVSEAGHTERTLPREWKDWFTRTAMPALRIPDFHMSSVSRAS